MAVIPIHYFPAEGPLRLVIARFEFGSQYAGYDGPAHRDDHYLFFLLEQGSAQLRVDFEEVSLSAGNAFYVAPGQVHEPIRNRQAQGWYLAVDPLLLPEAVSAVLAERLGLQPVLPLDAVTAGQCGELLRLLLARQQMPSPSALQNQVGVWLLQAVVGLVADGYSRLREVSAAAPRARQLSHAFRQLLATDFRGQKSPAAYAARLHVSANYLNEVLKRTTGFSVSHWITHHVLLEAKRLLAHTPADVQEVAYALGFTDPSYFSKLFKKHEGLSPVAFRAKNTE